MMKKTKFIQVVLGLTMCCYALTGQAENGHLPNQAQQANEVSSLQDIYQMLYEQEFYAHPNKGEQHQQALQAVAQKKGMTVPELEQDLRSQWRNQVRQGYQDRCWIHEIASMPRDRNGKIFNMCFEPTYLLAPTEYCYSSTGQKKSAGQRVLRTYEQSEQEIVSLDAKSKYVDWEIPTIEELFVMVRLLPRHAIGELPFRFWSATKTEKGERWIVTVETRRNPYFGTEETVFLSKIHSLQKEDKAFLIPIMRLCGSL
ncbi:MAG: hypothetical protein VSS75_013975 [Candidatus Parabeggiatoa sp.]|nr:hypothetical protein [Candidatus Parabeggiatoa sp.]